jgi:hypothetical protein
LTSGAARDSVQKNQDVGFSAVEFCGVSSPDLQDAGCFEGLRRELDFPQGLKPYASGRAIWRG